MSGASGGVDGFLGRYRELQQGLPERAGVAHARWQEAGGARHTGALLEAAGALLRRGERLGAEVPAAVDAALRPLPREAVQAWLGAALEGLRGLEASLARAADEGLEAALAEDAEEAALFAAELLPALRARDAVQSQASALARWEALAHDAGRPLSRQLEARLASVDGAHRAQARRLVAVNPARRAERDLLDGPERPRAWWFTARADCDGVLAALPGGRGGPALPPGWPGHLDSCLECLEDMEQSAWVERPLPQHLDADALWALDLGMASEGERARWQAHAGGCGPCARALEALEVGDAAIEEALALEDARAGERGGAPAPLPATRGQEAARRGPAARRPERQVLEERRDFRLLLVRDRGPLRLLVQPMRAGAVASALVLLPPGRTPLRPRMTPEGLDFTLGEEDALRTRALSVRLELAGTGEVYLRQFAL